MQRLQHVLGSIAAQDGVLGCGLVDSASGMVLASAGCEPLEASFETVVDHWRLDARRDPMPGFGSLRLHVAIYAQRRITLTACGVGMVLVTVSGEPDRVDWTRWKAGVAALLAAVRSL